MIQFSHTFYIKAMKENENKNHSSKKRMSHLCEIEKYKEDKTLFIYFFRKYKYPSRKYFIFPIRRTYASMHLKEKK